MTQDTKRKIATTAAAILATVMLIAGVMAFLPPASTHVHEPGPGDELTLIPRDDRPALERTLEPAIQLYEFISPDLGSAHHPFPKVCYHGHYVRPNHTYYRWEHYWRDGYHYHAGRMDHAIGADYRFRFRCGSRDHHYKTLPQGWW
jgi:hypothetical protein